MLYFVLLEAKRYICYFSKYIASLTLMLPAGQIMFQYVYQIMGVDSSLDDISMAGESGPRA